MSKMSSPSPHILRPVGNLERFSTVRHHLGYYRSVALTARYQVSAPPSTLPPTIETALSILILQHPSLCCGVINEDTPSPSFVRLDTINLSHCIEYRTLSSSPPSEYQKRLCSILEHQHSQLWPALDKRPGWKIIIIQQKGEEEVFDLIFAFHHAFADGLSGVVFHRGFLKALNNLTQSVDLGNHIIKVPQDIKLGSPVEKMVNFAVSWPFFLRQLWKAFKPLWLFPDPFSAWMGSLCSIDSMENYKMRVRFISIPGDLVVNILGECREQKATLTGLLHGLIVASLSLCVQEAKGFIGTTPYSLRGFSGFSMDEMGVQLSAISSRFDEETLGNIRTSSDANQLSKQIWNLAREFRTGMGTELKSLPNDNMLGMLPYVTDMQKMFTDKIGKQRAGTYEFSNVGNMKSEGLDGKWCIKQMVFTQSGNVTGSALSFNVVSVEGGPLTISLTWLEGNEENLEVDKMLLDVEYALRCIGEGKDVEFGL